MRKTVGTAALALVLWLAACVTMSAVDRGRAAEARGRDLRKQHKLIEAHQAYVDAIKADSHNLTALLGYVETCREVGRLSEAEAYYSGVLVSSPNDANAHEGLGLALFAAGGDRASAARAELTRAVELAPDEADFQYRLGLFYVESDRYDDAKAPLAKAVQLAGKHVRYRLPYAVTLARIGERGEAVKQLQAVLALNPSSEEMALAEKTAKNLIDPFRGFPPAAREQFEIALNWLDHESPAQAVQVLDGLLQKYPDLAIVHTMLGLAAAKNDDASQAIYSLKRAIDLDPDLAEPRAYLGDIYFSRGRPDNAREHYEAAIARNPFLAETYRHLAEVHLKASEPAQAVDEYRTYLLLRPDDVDATLGYCKVLGDTERPEAAGAWDAAKEKFARRPDVLIGRARYYFVVAAKAKTREDRARAKAQVVEDLEKVIELDPENTTATNILSQARLL